MLFDLHVHTAEGSPCAKLSARDTVNVYKEKGFDGIVITDHVSRYYMEYIHKLSFDDYCKYNYEAYNIAKDEGDKVGLNVLYGCELKLDRTGHSDYLMYGVKNEFLRGNQDIMTWSLEKLKEECDKNGILIYQAHPFRTNAMVVEPHLLFGVEVANGSHCNVGDKRNTVAKLWAELYSLHRIAGSDCHTRDGAGRCGVNFMSEIHDMSDLLKALSEDKYYLFEQAVTNR